MITIKLRELNIQKLLDQYEEALFGYRKLEIAEACEFELFNKDELTTYGLGFNRLDGTYAIVEEHYEEDENGEIEWSDTFYIEEYPLDFYNREFLVSRIVKLIEKVIL